MYPDGQGRLLSEGETGMSVMSDCTSIYVFCHCVSACMFVQSGGRQWAFVSQHPIFLLGAHSDTHTRTHTST